MRILWRRIQQYLFTRKRNEAFVIICKSVFTFNIFNMASDSPLCVWSRWQTLLTKPNKRTHYQWLKFIKCTWSLVGIFGWWLGLKADMSVSLQICELTDWRLLMCGIWLLWQQLAGGGCRAFVNMWSVVMWQGDVTSAVLLTLGGIMGGESCLHCEKK